ncbi:MAG TPA: hypothetical protein VGK73_18560 [Polyangiaceae bacterium]
MAPAVLLGTIALVVVAAPAQAGAAAEPREQAEVEILALAAFGAGGSVDDDPTNRYGLGFGARAGVTLRRPRLYLGGSLVRFLGEESGTGKHYTATLDFHAGYDLRLVHELLLIRPELALGVAQAVTIQSDNAGYPLAPHVAPGLLAGVRLNPLLVFAEIRGDFVIGSDWSNSFTTLLGAGVIF